MHAKNVIVEAVATADEYLKMLRNNIFKFSRTIYFAGTSQRKKPEFHRPPALLNILLE